MKNTEVFYLEEDGIASAKPTDVMKAHSVPSPEASTKRLAGLLKFDVNLGST